jgi:hypothetical protein
MKRIHLTPSSQTAEVRVNHKWISPFALGQLRGVSRALVDGGPALTDESGKD